jgi:uncharacterized protein with von Willebrand factor type A (vWA) domain
VSSSSVPTTGTETPVPGEPSPTGDRLAANLLHFVRLLRRLGFSVSATQVSDLLRALALIDVATRDDFYCVARCCLVRKPDDLALFDRAFQLFWLGREQWLLEMGMADYQRPSSLQQQAVHPAARASSKDRFADRYLPEEETDHESPEGTDLSTTYSPWETLRRKDFAAMSDEEVQAARRWIDDLVWRLGERQTRRRVRAHKRTRFLDLSETMRRSMKHQGEIIHLAWSRPKRKPRPLVLICDISGSMERYSRLFLHFMYAMRQSSKVVESFVFGTRLTRITVALRHRNVDAALNEVSSTVVDWSGGTRIGESLRTFNYDWGRRVLRYGAAVIIISDGWDRGDTDLLGAEMARLQRSCHRLLWLNPLAGAADYQPLVRGMRAALPYVDALLPLHNLDTLEQLSVLLSALAARGRMPAGEAGCHAPERGNRR